MPAWQSDHDAAEQARQTDQESVRYPTDHVVISTTDLINAQAETSSPEERQVLLEQPPVRDIMTPKPFIIEPTAEVQAAARHMLYAEARRLFVEENGVLVGVISQTDIVRAVATGKIA